MYRTQQMMIWIFPVVFLISGIAFPIGVLVYWVVSNMWATGQQLYMITNAPAPGSKAYEAKKQRDRAKRIKKGLPPEEPKPTTTTETEETSGQRRQPVSKNRAKKKGLPKEVASAVVDPVEPESAEEKEAREKAEKERDKGGLTPAERAAERAARRAEQRRIAREKRGKNNRKKS